MTVSVDHRLKPAKGDWEQPVEVAVPSRPSKQSQLPSTPTSLQPQQSILAQDAKSNSHNTTVHFGSGGEWCSSVDHVDKLYEPQDYMYVTVTVT